MRRIVHKELGRIGAPLAEVSGRLHPLDYEDVCLSVAAMRVIRKAGEDMLARHAPEASHKALSAAKAVALFVDRVFWNERTGDLVLCSDLAPGGLCLPVPKGMWAMRSPRTRLH